jgi:colicin import membrane protein
MAEYLRQQWSYIIGAVLLHALFAGLFALSLWHMARNVPPPVLAIQAFTVDPSVLNQTPSRQQREKEQAEARARQQAEERRKREEAERLETEQRAEEERKAEQKKREEERVQLEQQQAREREDAVKREAEAEKQRQAEAEKQRRADAERKRVEEIQRQQKEAEQKRLAAAEERAQQTRESDLKRQLEEEEGRAQAENSGLLNQYIAMIEQRVVRNWNRPPSAQPGVQCEVKLAQTPNGTVVPGSVSIGACNGDLAVKQSIEAAVMRSSPLPAPPDARLFQRNLVLIFKPAE